MATDQSNAPNGAPSGYVRFDALQARLHGLLQGVRLVDQRLWNDFAELPEEFQPAASVLHGATAELDALYDQFDQWAVRHEFLLKSPQEWSRPAEAPSEQPQPSGEADSDRTADRIRAFLDRVQTLSGCVFDEERTATHKRAQKAIERLAASAHKTEAPQATLTVAECADVLRYLADIEPVDAATWFDDSGVSHLCGQMFIFEALERSLRGAQS